MQRPTSARLTQAILLSASSLLPVVAAQAQPKQDVNSGWAKILQANSRISACHVVWDRVQHINSNPKADAKEWAARALASGRRQGLPEAQALKQARIEGEFAARARQGFDIHSTLNFVRVGNSILCNIETQDAQGGNKTIEFSNGTEFLFASVQVRGHAVPKDAVVSRASKEVLKMSISGDQVGRMLLGIPLSQSFAPIDPAFTPRNSSLTELADGKFQVERGATWVPNQGSQYPSVTTFDKVNLYPTSAEIYKIMATFSNTNKIVLSKFGQRSQVVATGYKQYMGGIWFPSQVTVTNPIMSTEYSLVGVKFNDQVDPADLLLPPSLRVADARFGYGPKLAIYNVSDGKLPTDAQVKEMLALDKQARQAKNQDAKTPLTTQSSTSPVVPLGGLGFIALGGLMLLGGRQKEQ